MSEEEKLREEFSALMPENLKPQPVTNIEPTYEEAKHQRDSALRRVANVEAEIERYMKVMARSLRIAQQDLVNAEADMKAASGRMIKSGISTKEKGRNR
jgi:hypothetical protein